MPHNIEDAREDLLYIRKTLEAAGQFTAVPGKSLVAAGCIALAGVAFNAFVTGAPWSSDGSRALALDTWGVVLGLALAAVGFGMYRKMCRQEAPVHSPLVRKLAWSLCPSLFLGAMLTYAAVRGGNLEWLPAIWLGCYGVAVTNGGQVSVPPVRYMGLTLLAAAAGSAAFPGDLGLAWLAVGFGWVHLVFGVHIARRYNG